MVGDIVSQIEEFVEQRDWKKFHNPKDLAISISLEASELLELFQWKSSEESVKKYPNELKEELADILIYCIQFASIMGYDIEDIITSKLKSYATIPNKSIEYCVHNATIALNIQNIIINIAISHVEKFVIKITSFPLIKKLGLVEI